MSWTQNRKEKTQKHYEVTALLTGFHDRPTLVTFQLHASTFQDAREKAKQQCAENSQVGKLSYKKVVRIRCNHTGCGHPWCAKN